MSTRYLPCGVYHQNYRADHALWQTNFVRGKMVLLFLFLFIGIPWMADDYWLSVYNQVGYTVLGALGVQLLIGFCGQVTLGHAAFLAVGAYTSTLLILEFPWPGFIMDWGLAYPFSILIAAVTAGLWSVLFGLPSARVKGFYLILTTMAAQFITVRVDLTERGGPNNAVAAQFGVQSIPDLQVYHPSGWQMDRFGYASSPREFLARLARIDA